MPPKKSSGDSKKTEQKKKEKIIEDKTFGLKNKKGNKQQKFIKNVTQQVKVGNVKVTKLDELKKVETTKSKDEKKKQADELNSLFRPVQQTVGKGVDPKSVVCAFFKLGQCTKGGKCKFSHDLTMDRKGEKRSVYDSEDKNEDSMEGWDEEKLEEVVAKKHGEQNKSLPPTSIICKYFVDALENSKYGWFWQCPGGEKCHYRHALPPGFVLKKDMKKEEKKEEISLEDLIEKERASLGGNLTKITLESFMRWKEKKRKEKIAKAKETKDKKKTDFHSGKLFGVSGRELFEFNPDLVEGDDEGADDTVYQREEDEEDKECSGNVTEIKLEDLSRLAREVDGTGTARKIDTSLQNGSIAPNPSVEDGKLMEAAALPPDPLSETDAAISAAVNATLDGDEVLAGDIPIDENLFDGEDLDLIDEDLETLDLDS